MNKYFSVLSLAALLVATPLFAGEKSDLSVLYVGLDPEKAALRDYEKTGDPDIDARALGFQKSRTADFEKFLSKHFNKVKAVYAQDYEEALSANFDVTIFGDTPKSIGKKPMKMKRLNGEMAEWEMDFFLSPEFDHASILIGDASPRIAEPLEYKMNWYCKCMDAHAVGMDLDHPVFNTPYAVDPTIELRETPDNFKKYYIGRRLGETMAMWRVQTEGYMDEKGFPIGMVAQGLGFDDAPDTEIISGGVNTKTHNAVALGRHGNFFHWGFIASPSYMTDEAKKVFLNTVHYITQFEGQKPYSRRSYKASARDHARRHAWTSLTDDYEHYAELVNGAWKAYKKQLQTKQENGETLSFEEKRALTKEVSPYHQTREEYFDNRILGRLPASLVEQYGDDLEKYFEYYDENFEYLAPTDLPYKYLADEDAKALSISNRDPAILAVAIRMLEQDENDERARGILTRYTHESFETAAEWRTWYEDVRGRLYFSDVYKFKFEVVPVTAGH